MARKPTKRTEFVLFDVIYEDGSQRSNRREAKARYSKASRGDARGQAPLSNSRTVEIAEKSGQIPLQIKSIQRAGAKHA